MRPWIRVLLSLFVVNHVGHTVEPPCGLDYGTVDDRRRIQTAMLDGSAAEVRAAIDAAKTSRGLLVGCAQASVGPREPVDTAPIAALEISHGWNELVAPELAAFAGRCPGLGRQWPTLALAAYKAHQAGAALDVAALERVATMALDQQYGPSVAAEPLVAPAGVFGAYLAKDGDDPCRLPGVPGDATAALCQEYPAMCPQYRAGQWAGLRFAVTDHVWVNGEMVGDPGGLGFDQGWIGAMLVETALSHPDQRLRHRCRIAAERLGRWALNQPLVTNHNYTAKLIWLLAQQYAWSGRREIRDGLLDRLERNLAPAVLTDRNHDGLVDGIDGPVAFAELAPAARTPGRMWDGHNALPWYHSMNALAMVEAYVALRDRGDTTLAAGYRPLALAMVDNLAHEIVHMGPPSVHATGWTDTPYAILVALWKIARSEGEPRPLWEDAVRAMWHTGAFTIRGSRMHNIGWYLLLARDVPYQPLASRAARARTPRSLTNVAASPQRDRGPQPE